MNKESIYILEDRGILYVSGDDNFNYLQNIISNDLNKVTDTQSCFSYLLTPQGLKTKIKLTVNFMKRKSKEYDELKKELHKDKNRNLWGFLRLG